MTTMDVPAERIARRAGELAPDLERLSAELYEDPELGFAEFRSVERIAELLRRHGSAVELGTGGVPTAFRARAGSAEGPQVAILAEYDALPGVGHGCGHNVIAASGVGAFLALAPFAGRTLPGGVTLLGTPAEEGGGGKEYLLQAGSFDGHDAAVMVHPGPRDIGAEGSSAKRQVVAVFTGRTAHAAVNPHLGLNALDGAVGAYQAIAQLRQHILPTDRVHGVFREGGTRPNIVPERAVLEYFLRSRSTERIVALSARVEEAFRGAALAAGVDVEVTWDDEPVYLPLRPNAPLAHAYAESLAGRREVQPVSEDVMAGSSDVGNVSQVLPTIQPYIAFGAPDIPGHSRERAESTQTPEGRRALLDAAIGLAVTAARVLADPVLREAAWADFRAQGPPVRVGDLLPLRAWPDFPAPPAGFGGPGPNGTIAPEEQS